MINPFATISCETGGKEIGPNMSIISESHDIGPNVNNTFY